MKEFSFSRLSLYETCNFRFYYKYVLGIDEPDTKPLALGKAVHKALESIVNRGTDINEAIQEGFIECNFHEEVTYDEIRKLVENAPLKNLKGETEVYFRIPLFDCDDSPILQGYIDILDGNKIGDYKTNRKAHKITDNYQIGLYAWAIHKIKGYSFVEGTLYFLRQKKESRFIFTKKEMEEAADWARKLVKEIRFKLEVLDIYPDKLNELFPYNPSHYCYNCPIAMECYKKNKII